MRKTPLIHVVASIGKVVFSILQVFSVIGAVGLLLGTLSLSFLPAGTVETETSASVTMRFRLSHLVEGDITEYRDLLLSGFEGAEKTEDGFQIQEITPSVSLENRKMALSLIPSFAQMVVLFFFYRALKNLCANLKESPLSPFTPEAPEIFKSLGISLFFLAGAPWLTAAIIQLITGIASDLSLEMGTVLWGLFALVLSEIFRIGSSLAPTPFPSSPYPPQEEKKDDSENHPGAF